MTKRGVLADLRWEIIRPLLPRPLQKGPRTPGRPVREQSAIANVLRWLLSTAAPWRDLCERLGPWRTAYHHFNRWGGTGVFDRITKARQACQAGDGYSGWDLW
jgi:transposase